MRLIAKVISISRAKFHCNRLTTVQYTRDYASLILWQTVWNKPHAAHRGRQKDRIITARLDYCNSLFYVRPMISYCRCRSEWFGYGLELAVRQVLRSLLRLPHYQCVELQTAPLNAYTAAISCLCTCLAHQGHCGQTPSYVPQTRIQASAASEMWCFNGRTEWPRATIYPVSLQVIK